MDGAHLLDLAVSPRPAPLDPPLIVDSFAGGGGPTALPLTSKHGLGGCGVSALDDSVGCSGQDQTVRDTAKPKPDINHPWHVSQQDPATYTVAWGDSERSRLTGPVEPARIISDERDYVSTFPASDGGPKTDPRLRAGELYRVTDPIAAVARLDHVGDKCPTSWKLFGQHCQVDLRRSIQKIDEIQKQTTQNNQTCAQYGPGNKTALKHVSLQKMRPHALPKRVPAMVNSKDKYVLAIHDKFEGKRGVATPHVASCDNAPATIRAKAF